MTNRRRGLLLTAALVSLAVGVAGIAWACSPQAQITPNTGATGPSGAPMAAPGQEGVRVDGKDFLSGRPVDIHWNATNGAVLATATGPSFQTTITIPESARTEQHYTIYAITQNEAGTTFTARASIWIAESGGEAPKTSERSPGTPRDKNPGGGPKDATTPGGKPKNNGGNERVTTPGGAYDPNANRNPNDHPGRNPSANPARNPNADPGSGDGSISGASTTITTSTTAASSLPSAMDDGSGRRVFGGSVGPGTRQSATQPSAGGTARTPSDGSASSDLWSGFSEDGSPSLLPGIAAPGGNPAGTRLALGVVLMGLGLIALLGGLVAAERRRRVLAHAGEPRRRD